MSAALLEHAAAILLERITRREPELAKAARHLAWAEDRLSSAAARREHDALIHLARLDASDRARWVHLSGAARARRAVTATEVRP